IAELHSAGLANALGRAVFWRPADCKSAIQQIENLRYVTALAPWCSRLQIRAGCAQSRCWDLGFGIWSFSRSLLFEHRVRRPIFGQRFFRQLVNPLEIKPGWPVVRPPFEHAPERDF